jgi:hypothetical protein
MVISDSTGRNTRSQAAPSEGRSSGTTTSKAVRSGEAPEVRAASSKERSIWTRPLLATRTPKARYLVE